MEMAGAWLNLPIGTSLAQVPTFEETGSLIKLVLTTTSLPLIQTMLVLERKYTK